MACPITDNNQRKYPLKQPDGWKPKVPRWTLRLPDSTHEIVIAYIGVQDHGDHSTHRTIGRPQSSVGSANSNGNHSNGTHQPTPESSTFQSAVAAIEKWTQQDPSPVVVDRFTVLSGRDLPGSREWACYWISCADADTSLSHLNLRRIHDQLPRDSRHDIGLWLEVLHPDLSRFETNYSGDDYRPGLASVAGTKQLPHELTGYWGAARDRIPSSAHDLFESNDCEPTHCIASDADTTALWIRGTNGRTIAHIRSGQFWADCSPDERRAYESELEPSLLNGLDDIHSRPDELGDYGLRFLRNISSEATGTTDGEERKETCAAGFFRSLADLEAWAKDCPSHHKIFGGAVHHKLKFGQEAKMRTWHEVCVLRTGEAKWEYLGCVRGTGTIEFQGGEVEGL